MTGPNDSRTEYECDDCGETMKGYFRVGDLTLCGPCRKERRLLNQDAAFESEGRLRSMEGHGDYEGLVTWP